jgi:Activator of Hsp90 ATPase homolog 1-like protein
MIATPTDQQSFTTTFSVDQSPEAAFAAIGNVRGWWGENIEGPTGTPGGEFTYRHKDVHRCTIRVTEMTSPTRVVWLVVDNYFNFTDDSTEWKGTEIRFDITRKGSSTEIRFSHSGLVPAYECFDVCSFSWGFYLQTSLRGLIRTGKGLPNPMEFSAS